MTVLTQQGMADAWGHECYHGPFATVTMFGGAKVSVRIEVLEAVSAQSACCKAIGYECHPDETGGFCCRHKTGNPNEVSNHGRGTADDLNWRTNPYGPTLKTDMPLPLIQAIEGIRTNDGAQVWSWGGGWRGNKDAMHFEICCTPRNLLSGINWLTVPGGPTGAPSPADQLTKFYTAVRQQEAAKVWATWGGLSTGWAPGTAPNVLEAVEVQKALNIVLPDTHIVEDGIWGEDSTRALFTFELDHNALDPANPINDDPEHPGAFTNLTKFFLGARVNDIANGRP